MLEPRYIVVCRDDADPVGFPGEYPLATHRVFPTRSAADDYARGVARSREPMVVAIYKPLRDF